MTAAKPAHPVFLILLNIILSISYTEETFLKDVVAAIFEVFSFILVLGNKRDCSPHKSALSCLCHMLSWTFVTSCLPWWL